MKPKRLKTLNMNQLSRIKGLITRKLQFEKLPKIPHRQGWN